MVFKISKGTQVSYPDPVALFNDLRTRKIRGIFSHQAEVLRDYVGNALNDPDVALQLPTGSGKTLVGLLLAEWRRRRFGERVVYLCPTRQLVNQVSDQARNMYGLHVNAFTGAKTEYKPRASSEYLNSEAVAITPYSALFNVNPFFDDPNLVILDDAHSAENYISSMWSLSISRFRQEHNPLFTSLLGCLKTVLGPRTVHLFKRISKVDFEDGFCATRARVYADDRCWLGQSTATDRH